MRPLVLKIENFLSYRKSVELLLESIHLACISGENGAGKSSLIDAITWCLFGQSRAQSRDDVVNRAAVRQGESARVELTFERQQDIYRIVRLQRPERTAVLDLQLQTEPDKWKTLTGSTMRETQAEIIRLLRMEYDTFINASFLLQGRADEFTVKTPGQRKEILGELLGVSAWNAYRDAARERKNSKKEELTSVRANLEREEQVAALEDERRNRLQEITQDLHQAESAFKEQEVLLAEIKAYNNSLEHHLSTKQIIEQNLERDQGSLENRAARRDRNRDRIDAMSELLQRSDEILERYKEWEKASTSFQEWSSKKAHHAELLGRKHTLLAEIESETKQLQGEIRILNKQAQEIEGQRSELGTIQARIAEHTKREASLRDQVSSLDQLTQERVKLLSAIKSLNSDQIWIKEEVATNQERIKQLETDDEGICPLCGQKLSGSHRDQVLADIQKELDTLAQKHKDNVSELKRLEQAKNQVEKSLADVNQADRELRQLEANLSADETRHKSIHDAIEKWLAEDTPRLEKLSADLQNEAYALDKRKNLDSLENEIKELDYSEDLFQQAKQLQESLADASRDMSELDRAQAESKSLQDSIEDLDRRIESLTNAVDSHKAQLLKIESAIADLGPAPEHSLDQVEDKLVHLREAVSVKSSDLGAQKQKITAAQQAKEKATELKQESKELSAEIQDLGKLEVAFGRNGVQALLIERAVPQLEDDTNRILRRLTDGILQVKFRTQKELKSRDAMVETLDIIIEDGYGKRPYAMYSGGETYRVNFAIRIALSKLLAHRAGAPLQTLVIDEGFGSQDPDGRQRLIQAINAIKDDFETILVITHIDELKDSFPTKIMVEKGESGSSISIQ